MNNTYKPRKLNRSKNKSQYLSYIIMLVVLIIFMSTVGIQLMLTVSRSIAGFNTQSESQDSSESDERVVIPPDLYDIPDATNEASLRISGSASGEGVITLYVNDEDIDSMTIANDDLDFNAKILLKVGLNTIYAEFKDKSGSIKDSDVFTVNYIKEKPELTISSPQDGSITDTAEISIKGTVSENTTLLINGRPVVVSSDGSFNHAVTLQEGDNSISATVTDQAGNTEEQQVSVRFER